MNPDRRSVTGSIVTNHEPTTMSDLNLLMKRFFYPLLL